MVLGLLKMNKTEIFIAKAQAKYGNRYDYSKVNYVNAETNVLIICAKHGERLQTPSGHLHKKSKTGCKLCGYEEGHNKLRSNTETFISRSKIIHNNKYSYSETEYVNAETKVKIFCPTHGTFEHEPHSHLRGIGCRLCYFTSMRTALDEFIAAAQEVHGNEMFDYSQVVYVNALKLITIICRKHGSFMQAPNNHLNSQQPCLKCRLCPSCELFSTGGVELCSYCKPQNIKKLYQKTKEYAVVKYLKEKLPDYEFIHNKSVGKDCTDGHLFPDILYDCAHYNLIVEIDEHRHRGAAYECDKQRMYDIITKTGKPNIFIRFNPDCKQSDKDILVETVKKYINIDIDSLTKPWDDFGFLAVYLFY